MAYLDQYIVDHRDRTLRLTSAIDAGRSALPVVRVGSRDFQKYVDSGYRVVNPNNSMAHHRNAALGLHRIMALTLPGYALANEAVGGHGSHSRLAAQRGRNPIGDHGYTSWAGVLQMKRHAKEMGHPELVKTFAESDANYAHSQLEADLGRGKISQRFTMAPFTVSDRKRVSGYAPEKWIEEDYDTVRESEDKVRSREVDAMIARTKAIQAKAAAEIRKQTADIQSRMDPAFEALALAVDRRVQELETKGESASIVSPAAKAVEKKAEVVKSELTKLQRAAKIAKGAYSGAKAGWSGYSGWEVDGPVKPAAKRVGGRR